MGGTLCYTGWLLTCVDPVHTQVTLDGFAGIRILDRYVPWAGSGAGHAADAFVLINIDNTVFPLDHSVFRAYRNAHGVLTVAAMREGDLEFGHTTYHLQRGCVDFAEKGTDRQVLVSFAVDLAAMTGDTAPAVEVDHIFFHS